MTNSIDSQGAVKLVPKKNKEKDFLVYYDEFNGSISSVTTQLQDYNTDPYIIDDTGLAKDIVKGILSDTKYAVGYKDYEANELKLVKKTNLINFVKRDADLYKIPRKNDSKGITFIFYKDSQLLEIQFNAVVLGNYNNTLWRNQFKLAFAEQFIIYLIDKKDPDKLEARFVFPLADIFDEGSLLIPSFSNFDPDNMDICIKRHFRDYSLVIKDKFVETDYHRNKLGRLNMVKEFTQDETSHIDLIQHEDNNLEVISHLVNATQVSQYEKQLKFYICDEEDPDYYDGALSFDWKDLIPKKHRIFDLQGFISLKNKMLLYDGSRIKITFRGEDNNVENTNN